MKNLSIANTWNAALIDENYERWLENPNSLDLHWRAFFEGFELARSTPATKTTKAAKAAQTISGNVVKEAKVIGAIYAYRNLGHTQAHLNPLEEPPPENPRLNFEYLGFTEEDLNQSFHTGNYLDGITLPLGEILERLKTTYCSSVGCEYLHIQGTEQRRWLQDRIESTNNQADFSPEKQIRILRKVIKAEAFEQFLHAHFIGQKRFSLEGGEAVIAALDSAVENAPTLGLEEIVMGMAHRGRLNVLANIINKSYDYIFREFSENFIPESIEGDGDVKYHLGYQSIRKTEEGHEVELRLAANPSHLEAVDPIVQGQARARQRIRDDVETRKKVLPILIHGDSAIAGQGIVAETFNISQLAGYETGGTLHFVINNQIGFTTNPTESRSSLYCTDVAKMVEAPIFHVNGDDPIALVMVTELALAYRQEFRADVVIDMYCYRKYGHNEADEPKFTQPTLYAQISKHKSVSHYLAEQLIEKGLITDKEVKKIRKDFETQLKKDFEAAKKHEAKQLSILEGSSAVFQPPYSFKPASTKVSKKTLTQVAKALTSFPEEFKVNPKIKRQMDTKWKAFQSGQGIDWGFGETLTYGTLLAEGIPVRLSGQDCERGTFSHRHAVLYATDSREAYVPLRNINKNQEMFCVHNSSLSEAAILGFDYGYSLDYPQMLCIWEAQFGDFANGAQVIIDQFIASSESKWQQVSGIVMLLPHGYEGQGPEHSSARLERFLQACAENNIQVCNVTTPAQLFHVLRRQVKRSFRKPLIIMTPKSLLRHKECVSSVDDFVKGHFEEILPDPNPPKKTDRIIFCSGKLFYELLNHRTEKKLKNTAIIRIEQLYPLHEKAITNLLKKHAGFKKIVWAQEEPKNMGAWSFIAPELEALCKQKPLYVGRKPSASPAVGTLAKHKLEQASVIETAFTI
tara:strand:+ start:302 stop:3040 length:2739 start_codon:yes stop_codon:yes gene_type:complete